MSSSRPEGRSAERVADALALCILVAVAIIAALTFRDYGLGWDDYTHAEYGGLLLNLYASGFSDQRALSFVNLYAYGGGFDMLSALAAKVLPFDLFETRRLVGAIVGLIGIFITWRLARRVGGPLAALIAVALLATCPLYYGNMFMNAKDAPFAVAMVFLTLALVRALEEYPRPSPIACAMVGVGAGLAIGTRVLGGLAAINALAALALIVAVETHRAGLREAGARLGAFAVRFLPALLVGYAVMALVWPWSVAEPLNPFRAVEYFSHFFEKPWKEMFDGMALPVPEMPRQYVPQLFLLKEPEIFLALGIAGTAGAVVAALRRDIATPWRAIYLLLAFAGVFPIALAVLTRPAMYNGIRHFVFVAPAIAVLGGLAGAWIGAALWRSWRPAAGLAAAVLLAGLFVPVKEMVKLHPYQYTHFNLIAGGIRGADDRYMLDYWGLSFKQAAQELRARLTEGLQTPTDGRRWRVAICGPLRPAQVELGPEFLTTWDTRNADFAFTMGEFYCANLPAPVLVEIEREGVVYARVYDIRGRTFTSLNAIQP
ncbi:MAG TPA: glycosyltransferase family 39 protein [Xanthobacteraceae bacterium]|jgi:4-amino-4-deoxy-L-arabinose transferase-like glycosyltransferase|nr:glycosyltransferase family 39 protein [Xanthobacteraceae bacterium]